MRGRPRWVVCHGQADRPGFRQVCTTHWTRLMAVDLAAQLEHSARCAGYFKHTYWAEPGLAGDYLGRVTQDGAEILPLPRFNPSEEAK